MQLVVRKNDLLRELQLLQGIVERKNTMIPANVLMGGKGDNMRFLATHLEFGLPSQSAASVEKGGA